MPTDALANPLVLPILGLLVERPRHAYSVFDELRTRYAFLRVRNATVYTLVNTLEDTGWIAPAAAGGDRQEYALTEAGAQALADRVDHDVRATDLANPAAFMTALAYLGILAPDQAEAALAARCERIREEVDYLDLALGRAGVSELHMIEAHYYRDRLRQDGQWLENTILRIRSGALAWPGNR
ncbi:PadR family transcriptional regulator [Amycolatopsis sp. PS_44_ISF1]|uniref:PadR family transcriptional regulator n=1 Tax=Amycolatopsis sp. PS_44_ISF1 TaxID=2974917 RepID=UPI0028DE510F|nr:PadR family transcriptional regulator [Amycolatopsis sp. PS_44_ISF1]MDT8911595.1 PadR family transcriptional regulator [Amycolatopsis sp. PS_44_ISF1]